MSAFRARLMQSLKHHLESETCRYDDNSLLYFLAPVPDARALAQRKEALWFKTAAIPSFKKLLDANAADIYEHIRLKERLYDRLEDAYSKETLVAVTVFRLLGHRLVKHAYYQPDTIARRDDLVARARGIGPDDDMRKKIEENYFRMIWPMGFYDLSRVGFPLTLYTSSVFVYALVYDNDYRYAHGGVDIDVAPGDCVLDCGACMADTALSFALKAGPGGRVVSFEPNPRLFHAAQYNLALNEAVAATIALSGSALSDRVGEEVPFSFAGAGSALQREETSCPTTTVTTSTLDHEVRQRNLPKVDFIKMDIEGAELDALRGSEETIRRFKPKLAVCVYHKPDDYSVIPEYIDSLGLGYKFYLKHHFMNEWETVLYAVV